MPLDPAPVLAATPPPGPPAGLLVDRPRPCARCTYDLFRQPLDGKCPECGTEVAASVRARYLRDAGPAYVRALRQGADLVVAVIVVALVALGVGLAGMYLAKLRVSWRTTVFFQSLLDLGFLAATWRLTVADPTGGQRARRWGARAVMGLLAVVQVAMAAFVIGGRLDPETGVALPTLQRLWLMLVVVTALEAASTLAFGFTVAGLSRRLPAPGLARAIRLASVGFFLTLLIALANNALLLAWMHGRVSRETLGRVLGLIAWPENAGRSVFGVAAAVFLWAFARRLRAEAAQAADAGG